MCSYVVGLPSRRPHFPYIYVRDSCPTGFAAGFELLCSCPLGQYAFDFAVCQTVGAEFSRGTAAATYTLQASRALHSLSLQLYVSIDSTRAGASARLLSLERTDVPDLDYIRLTLTAEAQLLLTFNLGSGPAQIAATLSQTLPLFACGFALVTVTLEGQRAVLSINGAEIGSSTANGATTALNLNEGAVLRYAAVWNLGGARILRAHQLHFLVWAAKASSAAWRALSHLVGICYSPPDHSPLTNHTY